MTKPSKAEIKSAAALLGSRGGKIGGKAEVPTKGFGSLKPADFAAIGLKRRKPTKCPKCKTLLSSSREAWRHCVGKKKIVGNIS